MTVVPSTLVERDSEPEAQTDLWEPASLFVADWSSPIQFANSFTTVVHESRTGLESRAGVATKPRKTLMNQSLILSDSDVQHMKSTMRRAGEARTLTPLFCDPCPLIGVYNPHHPHGPSWLAKNVENSRLANTGWSALVLKDNTARAKTYAFCNSTTVSSTTNEVTFCDPEGETGCCHDSIFGDMSFGNPKIIANGSVALAALPSTGSTVLALIDTTSPHPMDGDHVIFCLSYNIKTGEELTVTNLNLQDKGDVSAINLEDGFTLISSKVAQSEIDPTVDRRVDVYRAKVQIQAGTVFGISWDASFTASHSSTGASSMIFDAMILDHREIDANNPFPPDPVEIAPWVRGAGVSAFTSNYESSMPGESVIELITAQASSATSVWDATGTSYTTPSPLGWTITDYDSKTTATTEGSSVNYEVVRDFRIAYCTTSYGTLRGLVGQLNEGGSDPTTQRREGLFTRIRINPSLKTAGCVLYPAIETDLSFGLLTEVVTREIAVVQNEANETIGIEGADPQIPIGSLPVGSQTVEHFIDGEYVSYPVLERSPSFESVVWENSITGDEAQYGIGRERHSYGESKTQFIMQYRFLNRSDAFDMIEFFQSRGGRLYPFFLVPPTTEFTVTGVNVEYKSITVSDNSLQDDYLDDSVGRYISVHNGSSYAVRRIESWSRTSPPVLGGVTSIVFILDSAIPSTHTTVADLDRAGIAHMCRFNQDEMMETWITGNIMESSIMAIELASEGLVSIQSPAELVGGVGCSQMLCGNSENVGICPSCCAGEDCEPCTCRCPQGNTMACGYCGSNSSCGPNPTDYSCSSTHLFDSPDGSGEDPFCRYCTATMKYTICKPRVCCSNNCIGSGNPEMQCNHVCANCCVTLEPSFLGCSTHGHDGKGPDNCEGDLIALLTAEGFGNAFVGGAVYYLADTGHSGKVLIRIQTGFKCDNIDTSNNWDSQGPANTDGYYCDGQYNEDLPSRKYSSFRWDFFYKSQDGSDGAVPKENDDFFFFEAFGINGCGGWAGACSCCPDDSQSCCGWYENCACGNVGENDIQGSPCSDRIERDGCGIFEKKMWASAGAVGCCDLDECGPDGCHHLVKVWEVKTCSIQQGGCGMAIDPVLGDDFCGENWQTSHRTGGCPYGCEDFGNTEWCN